MQECKQTSQVSVPKHRKVCRIFISTLLGGGNRLGATNPSQFEIEFYVNDLSVNVASTFEPLGKFSYNQNECINLECKNDEAIRKIPTDGLVLKGCYTTITLAVYGNIITYGNMPKIHIPGQPNSTGNNNNVVQVSSNDETNESDNGEVYNSNHHNDFQDQNSSCDPTVSSTIADDLKEDERTSPRDIYSRSPSKEQDLPKSKREWSNSPDGSYGHKRPRVSGSFDHRKLRSPPLQSPRISRPTDSDDEVKKDNDLTPAVEDLSTTFCPSSPNTPIESPTEMDEDLVELEPILSDEDISDDVNGIDDMSEEMFAEEFPLKVFNPFMDELRVVEPKLTSTDIARMQKVIEQFRILSESYNFVDGETVDESWVLVCEHINASFHSLSTQDQVEEVVSNLSEPIINMIRSCIDIGLDHTLAIQHEVPGCNLRHIKSGVRLIECLAATEKFIEVELFQGLIELLPCEFIPIPIKLLIARLIYQLIDTKKGVEKFLAYDGYKKVIDMLSNFYDVRLLYTLKAILKKIHTYEALSSIKEMSIETYRKVKANEDFDFEKITELENIFIALLETRKVDVMQPKKFIPISSQFEIAPGGKACGFTSYYKEHSFLEVLTILLDIKQMLTPKLLLLMLEYLSLMAKSGDELSFLVKNVRVTNDLVKMLLESDIDESTKHLNVEIGLEIAFKVEAKYHVDWISMLTDEAELTESLESLFNLCSGHGRKFVLDFIAMDENLLVFLNLIDKEKKISMVQGSPGFKQKSPVLSYCIDIVDFVVRHVENIDYLIRFDSILLNLVKHHDSFEPSVAAMLQEMAVFLKPLEIEKIFEYEDIAPLAEIVKRSMEFLTTFPGDLIMTLRILKYLIVGKNCGEYQELKHDFFAIQLYHADGAVTFLSILEKLTTHFDQPMIHSYLLGANQGNLLMQIVHPTVQILSKILVQVIRSRNISFRDVTAIETLMKIYTLMQSIHPRCSTFIEAKNVQQEIIRILLTYTQSLTPDGMTTTNIHKSLWTQMIGEVVKYTLSCPYHFVPGLMVFSELLPLPLPVPIQGQELSKLESQRLVTERQLWSAHLHPQSLLITEMIQTFCTTSTPELYQLIYRVCVQLSDLAPNMTLLVSKAVVDLIISEPLGKNHEATAALARLFKFLASIVRHSCVKVSILSILSGKLSELMSQLLTNVNDSNTEHTMAQFQVFMILHYLFDCEISMLFNSSHNPELILASGLPTKELIALFSNDVIENFCKTSLENLTFASIRAMILLTEHDTTFNILKTSLTNHKESFVERLNSIAEKCKNDKKQMVIIPDLLELFRALINIESNEVLPVPSRSMSLTTSELATLFKWNSEEYKNGTKIHFLEVFSALMNEPRASVEEEDIDHQATNLKTDLESLLEQLRESLKNHQEPVVASSDPEFNLAQAEGIVTQFSSRVAFYTTDGMDELAADYWLLNDGFEVSEDVVQCDLDELVCQCLPPDTNISSDCKRLLALSSSPQSTRERNLSGLCFRTRRVEVVDPIIGRPEKKIFSKCKKLSYLLQFEIKFFLHSSPKRQRFLPSRCNSW